MRSNRVVPRSQAFAPDRGGSFLYFTPNIKKGGGSVESDLGELELLYETECGSGGLRNYLHQDLRIEMA